MGDSRCMSEANDESVHLIITSPPYWQLKDYGTDDQIGFNDSHESYINNVNHGAIKFLEEKLRNGKVYLKFDQEKYDVDGNLNSYVYLENKTFINAHLLKNGFAQVDTKNKYAQFNKFVKIVQE